MESGGSVSVHFATPDGTRSFLESIENMDDQLERIADSLERIADMMAKVVDMGRGWPGGPR